MMPKNQNSISADKSRKDYEQLRLIFDTVPISIWFKDEHNRILRLNKSAAESMGMTVEEAEGKITEELFPEMAEKYHQDDLEVIRTGKPKLNIIERYTPAEGMHGWVSTDKVPYCDPLTGSKGVLAMSRDITKQQNTEDTLKEMDRRKNEFLAMLAHELRNPLAAVSNTLHMLKSPSTSNAVRSEAVDMANQQVTHMVRLLNDLLDVARITYGKITLQRKQVELGEIIRTAMDAAMPLITEKKQSLLSRLPPQPVWIEGDATRLSQLFGNLLNNAAKYTGQSGRIVLEARTEGQKAIIKVWDNGIGIAKDKLPYIFDMLMQVDNSMERSKGGLGIGLMLVKNIAELHGGTVVASSDGKDKGTAFTVTLPISSQKPMNPQPEESAQQLHRSSHPLRILVVDDNKPSAKTLGWMLEALGHDVRLAYDAKSAIAAAHDYKPDAVLLDIGLPDMNGYEICREMRTDPALRNTTFIAQTGWGQEHHLQRSHDAGFSAHLIKPISIERLQKQLESVKKAGA